MSRNVKLIYVHTIFTNMLFVLPVIVPYYRSIGLTFQDFLLGEALFSATVLLAEVPSGWLSDMWKRRTTLILGAVFGIAGYCCLMVADGLFMANMGQVIVGIAIALNSGTNTALLYDTLLEEGRVEEYRKLDGQRHAYGIYGVAGSALVGGFLFAMHEKLPLLIDIFTLVLAMIVIACVREPARNRKSTEKHMLHDMAVTMRYALHGHPEIAGIIILSAIVLCTTKLMLWASQPYYEGLKLPVEWFGFIMAGSYVVAGLAGQWSHKLDRISSNRGALILMAFMVAIPCLILALGVPVWAAVALFLCGTLVYSMGTPRINNAINRLVGPERRATVLSTGNLIVHILFIPTSLVVGYFSNHGGIHLALLWMAGQVLVLGLLGLWLWRKRSRA